jgi:Spx/MgsR family transcriptional regulator
MTIKLYGISNCDTVRKAKKWLETHSIPFQFHDFRKDGLAVEDVQRWLKQVPFETLLNKRSTTWKQLNDEQKQALTERYDLSLLVEHPTLIKRPVLEISEPFTVVVGFKPETYEKTLAPLLNRPIKKS